MKIFLKILLIALIVIVVLIIGAIVWLKYVTGALDDKHKSAPQSFVCENVIGKALMIYQPARTDITKRAAVAIAESLNKKGYDVTMNYPGDFLKKDISDYDIVVFGSPVYADKGSPLVTDYIKSITGLAGKKVILFTTGSVETDKVYDGLDTYLQGAAKVQKVKFTTNADMTKIANDTVGILCAQD